MSSRHRRRRYWLRVAIKAALITAIAMLLLLLWQQTAFAQSSPPASPTTSALTGEATGKATANGGKDGAGAGEPTSISEWVKRLQKQREAAKTSPTKKTTKVSPPEASGGTVLPKASTKPITEDGSSDGQGKDDAGDPAPPPEVDGDALGEPTFSGKIKPFSEINDAAINWTSTLQLILSLESEFKDAPPLTDPAAIQNEIYNMLLELSAILGWNDNPRENLDGLRSYIDKRLGYSAVVRDHASLDTLLPRYLIAKHRGSPVNVAMVALALADNVNKYLDLEPVLIGNLLGLRYRSGHHRYILVPEYLDQLYSDESFVELAFGESRPSAKIRVLTRQNFWGIALGEAGAALVEEGQSARAALMLERSLKLYKDQARARIALARVLLERLDVDSAREELDLAIELDPDNLIGRLARADLLEKIGDVDRLEADLRWLFHSAKHPRAGIRLCYHYLDRGLFTAAERELHELESRDLKPSDRQALDTLRPAIGAAPWIQRLKQSQSDRDRFRAIDELLRTQDGKALFNIPAVQDALVDTLDDPNLRLANYAYMNLKKMTRLDLPRQPAIWRQTFARIREPKKDAQ